MSRIRLNIDRLVLNGFQPLEAQALAEVLQSQLSQVLSDQVTQPEWARSHRTPVLKLGRVPLESGGAGARKLGAYIAHGTGRGLKP
ncbi:MAG TPA: hypothetical protein VNX60_08995 [Candidatus Acidoferrum sp.]|nr:hypothetical protein [Candidatus Acidoferrum sp.]